ncbi:MAG TPA: hypothetical protein DHV63_05810, partial [Pseudomonas sp.]|nr:hypothetical protein [Pseudomonas sp.]
HAQQDIGYRPLYPLAMLLIPGNNRMNRFAPPQPPDSRAVNSCCVWLLVPGIGILIANVLAP